MFKKISSSLSITLFLCLFACSSFAQSSGIQFFEGSFEDALKVAKANKKLVFVDAYTTWCGPCRWMSQNVFTNSFVGDYFNKNFVNLKLNMESPEGSTFAVIYGVNVYPTLVFLSDSGKEIFRKMGTSPAMSFLELGKEVIEKGKSTRKQIAQARKE